MWVATTTFLLALLVLRCGKAMLPFPKQLHMTVHTEHLGSRHATGLLLAESSLPGLRWWGGGRERGSNTARLSVTCPKHKDPGTKHVDSRTLG